MFAKSVIGAGVVVACVLCGLVGRRAWGVETNGFHVSDITFYEDGWAYIPILSVNNGAQQTESVLLVDQDDEQKQGKIVCVWYVRDASEPDGWTKKAWWESDPWSAVQQIKASRNISGEEDDRWGVKPLENGGGNGNVGMPMNYAQGVFEGDPLAPLTADPTTHDAVVALLEEIEYKSADVPIEAVSTNAGGGCGAVEKIEIIAHAAAIHAFGASLDTGPVAQTIIASASGAGCAGGNWVPVKTRPMGPAGPWGTAYCYYPVTVPAPKVVCTRKRTQRFIRVRSCTTAGVTCTQSAILTCEERAQCTDWVTSNPCDPPLPVPPTTNIPLGPEGDNAVPNNCSDNGWYGNNPPGCTCP